MVAFFMDFIEFISPHYLEINKSIESLQESAEKALIPCESI